MPPTREARAQFDAALRAGFFKDHSAIERLVGNLVQRRKIDLALELLELARGDPRLRRQWNRINEIRDEVLDSKMPRD